MFGKIKSLRELFEIELGYAYDCEKKLVEKGLTITTATVTAGTRTAPIPCNYEGEGYYKVWHDGKVVDVENFSDKAKQPKATWWVKLKPRSGAIGWTVDHGNFGNQDACG